MTRTRKTVVLIAVDLFAKLTKSVMARVKKRFDIIFSHSRGTH